MTFRLFTEDDRAETTARVRESLLEDGRIAGVHSVGSLADESSDRHSDVDLVVVVAPRAVPREVAADAAQRLHALLPVVRSFDVPLDELRVVGLLLENALEVDLAFGHEHALARLFPKPPPEPDPLGRARRIVDFVWHDVTHAAAALERERLWRALFYVERVRNDAIQLAALRTSRDAHHFREVDELAAETLEPLASALVAQLEAAELARALRAVTSAFFTEARRLDPALPGRLEQTLAAYLDAVLAPYEAPARA